MNRKCGSFLMLLTGGFLPSYFLPIVIKMTEKLNLFICTIHLVEQLQYKHQNQPDIVCQASLKACILMSTWIKTSPASTCTHFSGTLFYSESCFGCDVAEQFNLEDEFAYLSFGYCDILQFIYLFILSCFFNSNSIFSPFLYPHCQYSIWRALRRKQLIKSAYLVQCTLREKVLQAAHLWTSGIRASGNEKTTKKTALEGAR